MKPEWRTTTVVQLCQAMREGKDYSALPILADALQDAGCDDDEWLASLREQMETIPAQREVALICSEETAAAVRYLEQVVRDINHSEYPIGPDGEPDWDAPPEKIKNSDTDPHTYKDLIEAGSMMLGDGICFGTNAGSEFFYQSSGNRAEFYRNWTLITGIVVKDEDIEDLHFRCAC